eukprot:scaffold179_cov368-Prasinococcus_capsulatus_cf.AAC.46
MAGPDKQHDARAARAPDLLSGGARATRTSDVPGSCRSPACVGLGPSSRPTGRTPWRPRSSGAAAARGALTGRMQGSSPQPQARAPERGGHGSGSRVAVRTRIQPFSASLKYLEELDLSDEDLTVEYVSVPLLASLGRAHLLSCLYAPVGGDESAGPSVRRPHSDSVQRPGLQARGGLRSGDLPSLQPLLA